METIFTKIINQEIPSYKIAENDSFYAFLDINPNAKGHTLVIPKKPIDKLFDLDEETYADLFSYARKIAQAIEKVVPCNRVGLSVIGLEVPHAHVHLIPLNSMNDANFAAPKEKMTSEEFITLANKIAEAVEN
ncbi:HIT family protein [Flavicella sp.]|uniref:HIT family protein n=1 Tax=Flavicella sp. TaxID=2957742 RepID=UPI0026105CFA|nr:HIT family protein [Flavicella sp.]MDG1805895.1 HIT family protein [Flavicella sp.]MDG2280206.1 HIT family protein [Flavicella sp.]